MLDKTKTLERYLQDLVRQIKGLTRSEAGICYFETAPDKFKIVACEGLNEDVFPDNLTIKREVIEEITGGTEKPHIYTDISPLFSRNNHPLPDENYTFDTVIYLPLSFKSKCTGLLELLNPENTSLIRPQKSLKALFSIINTGFDTKMQLLVQEESLFPEYDVDLDIYKTKIIGRSTVIKDLLKMVGRIAPSDSTVLLKGETGTGKSIVAETIHIMSARSEMPFVKVHCAAIPENLLESELFGHEKGAFTGAYQRKIGRFERAHHGTIFLDEIGELTLSVQVKLLSVLQDQEFERLGGTETISVNTRIIAASNKNLESAIKAGEFREDLYYRLNVIPITIAPLRDRIDDIDLLVEFFVKRISNKLNRRIKSVSEETLYLLKQYHWPGNIRELENIIERALVIGQEQSISPSDLPQEIFGIVESMRGPKKEIAMREGGRTLWEVEKGIIQRMLVQLNWNQSKTARSLGISRNHLRYRIKKYGIKKDE